MWGNKVTMCYGNLRNKVTIKSKKTKKVTNNGN